MQNNLKPPLKVHRTPMPPAHPKINSVLQPIKPINALKRKPMIRARSA